MSDSDALVDMHRWPFFLECSAAVDELVSVRLASANRVKGQVVERASGDFAVMEVGSMYDGSRLEELRVGGVGLLHFVGGMLAPSIRAGAADADVLPRFVFIPVDVDEGLLEMSVDVRSHTFQEIRLMMTSARVLIVKSTPCT